MHKQFMLNKEILFKEQKKGPGQPVLAVSVFVWRDL